MTGETEWSLNSHTTQLVALSVYAVVSAALLWGTEGLPTAVRIPLALPLLLFAPGYALLSAHVPRSADRADGLSDEASRSEASDISTLERLLLAVVTSIALVPMVAIIVNALVGIRLGPILAIVAGVTVLGSALGILRARSGGVQTGTAPNRRSMRDLPRALADPLTLVAVVLTVALLGSSAALVVVDAGEDALETEFYIAGSETGEDPTTSGASYDLRITQDDVANQQYTVVVTRGETESVGTELDRFSIAVSAGETATRTVHVSGSDLESGTMVRFLLYRGDAPDSPDPDSAHRVVRQAVNTTR